MEFGHTDNALSQAGSLADHVHAAAELLFLLHRRETLPLTPALPLRSRCRQAGGGGSTFSPSPLVGEGRGGGCGRWPINPLGGDAQPAHVERLQRLADLVGITALAVEALLFLLERRGVRSSDAADGVAGAGLQQDGLLAAQRFPLVARHDGAAGDGFLGEQVRGADENADGDAALGEAGRQRGHHRRRQRIVDTTREQDVQFVRLDGIGSGGGELLPEQFAHRLPQHEARTRPDVPAALAALEDETPRPVAQKKR